jgi:hypothetical protein
VNVVCFQVCGGITSGPSIMWWSTVDIEGI